jgi:hypothetical protein
MSPEEALAVLDQAAARALLTRQEQITVMNAVNALKKAIEKPKEKVKEAK